VVAALHERHECSVARVRLVSTRRVQPATVALAVLLTTSAAAAFLFDLLRPILV
jgi:hypothetical protein